MVNLDNVRHLFHLPKKKELTLVEKAPSDYQLWKIHTQGKLGMKNYLTLSSFLLKLESNRFIWKAHPGRDYRLFKQVTLVKFFFSSLGNPYARILWIARLGFGFIDVR